MGLRVNDNIRNDAAAGFITRLGSGGKAKFYNGARPTNLTDAPAGTLLATLSWTGSIGTSAAGVINVDETVNQTAASHVNGTPTYVRFETSADVVVADLDVGASAGQMNVTGTIQNNVPITLTAPCTITMPAGS